MKKFSKEYDSADCLITIITVSKDDAYGLRKTVQSISEQYFKNYELIVIEGGGNEGDLAFLDGLASTSTHVLMEADVGIYHAMNKGIVIAEGTWLVYMNSGDVFASCDALSNAVELMSANVDVVYSDWMYGSTLPVVKANLQKLNVRHQAVIYRKSLHQVYGNYVVGKGVTISDYIFFLSISEKNWIFCQTPLAVCDKNGASSNPRHFYQRIASELIFGKRSVLNSCCIFLLYPFYRFVKRNILRVG